MLEAACEAVVQLPSFAHHLAKAAVERWFAFDLAHALDVTLAPMGWTALVERGGTGGLGNFDLLILPIEETEAAARMDLSTHQWSGRAIAIELKAAHLSQGEAGRRDGLLTDLTGKPSLAATAGRPCSAFLGVMITTDGLGTGVRNEATKARSAALDKHRLPLADGISCLAWVERDVAYRGWSGRVWVEIVGTTADTSSALLTPSVT
jgi:hypothetical protein